MAKRVKKSSETSSATPPRHVHVSGDGGNAEVGEFGVAVAGNRGLASSLHFGASIAGDVAAAVATNGGAALAGLNSHASVGDGGVARAGTEGLATGQLISMVMVDDRAWAISAQVGVALARAGLAETFKEGVAVAQTLPPADGGWRGIAIAGPCGIAVAFNEGVVVKAGPGGALAGYWNDGTGTKLALQQVSADGTHKPDTLYRFVKGSFVPLTKDEKKVAQDDIAKWRRPWIGAVKAPGA